jgi:hypothetical protein
MSDAPAHGTRGLPGLVLAVATVAVAAHASLLPLARWYPDEFYVFANQARFGWDAVSQRIFAWSPRPVSELLIYAYGHIVEQTDSPMPAAAVFAAWLGVLGTLLLAARSAAIGPVVPVALLAAALLVARPGEMWFWPAAALAYLPALAGLGAAAMLMIGPARGPRRDLLLCAALLLAAGSCELGALAVVALSAGQLVREALARFGLLPPDGTATWVWVIPALLAVAIIGALIGGRAGYAGEAFAAGEPVRGDIGGSLVAALRPAWRTLAGVPPEPELRPAVWLGVPFKLACAAGFWALLPAAGRTPGRRLTGLVSGLAFLGVAFGSIALGFFQFGFQCCDRHETFRQSLVVLAMLGAAAALPAPPALAGQAAMAVLAMATAALLWLRLPAIRADLALIPAVSQARMVNWSSGQAPGDAMDYRTEPPGRITSGWSLAPGEWRRADRTHGMPAVPMWHPFAIMLFFDKMELRSLGPAQGR